MQMQEKFYSRFNQLPKRFEKTVSDWVKHNSNLSVSEQASSCLQQGDFYQSIGILCHEHTMGSFSNFVTAKYEIWTCVTFAIYHKLKVQCKV